MIKIIAVEQLVIMVIKKRGTDWHRWAIGGGYNFLKQDEYSGKLHSTQYFVKRAHAIAKVTFRHHFSLFRKRNQPKGKNITIKVIISLSHLNLPPHQGK